MYKLPAIKGTFLLLIVNISSAFSQNKLPVNFGTVTAADFTLAPNKIIDSNTNAVIIANVGTVEYIGSKKENWVDLSFKRSTKIKILNKKGYDLATNVIRLLGEGDDLDKLEDFHASTYNLENGKVMETKLSDKDLFDKKVSKWRDEKRFTMPDVKEGSVIEYSYTITSSHFNNVPVWYFQSLEAPSLYSEFKIGIPDMLRLLQIRYGIDSFFSATNEDVYSTIYMANVKVGTHVHNHDWVMKNIPIFKKEDFISEPWNYLDRIEFTLSQIYNGENVSNIYTDWPSAEKKLRVSKWFGAAINTDNASNLYNVMKKICPPDADDMAAARQIYSYIRDNFTCVPDDDIYLSNELYDVNKVHKGSVSELNMLLIALLRQRGINANPVILATRSYGFNSETYPILDNLNYVICLMTHGKDTIFLDASDRDLGFGKIPLECYNGHSRVIGEQYSGPIYLFPTSIDESNKTSVMMVNNETGTGEAATLEQTLGYYESSNLRSAIKQKDGQQTIFKEIKKGYGPEISISNFHIDSLTQVDKPAKEVYDIDFKNGFSDDVIYFNPVVTSDYKENPFKATDRKFPVELPYPINDTYDLTMDIPNGYTVDELPKSVKATFNESDGMFTYLIAKDAYTVQLHMQLRINKTFFAPEDYNSLRDFFSMVIKKQSEQVVFKKK